MTENEIEFLCAICQQPITNPAFYFCPGCYKEFNDQQNEVWIQCAIETERERRKIQKRDIPQVVMSNDVMEVTTNDPDAIPAWFENQDEYENDESVYEPIPTVTPQDYDVYFDFKIWKRIGLTQAEKTILKVWSIQRADGLTSEQAIEWYQRYTGETITAENYRQRLSRIKKRIEKERGFL